jgi:hypothetical protein
MVHLLVDWPKFRPLFGAAQAHLKSGKGEVGGWVLDVRYRVSGVRVGWEARDEQEARDGEGAKSEKGGQMFLPRFVYVGLGRRLVFGRPCPPFMLG